MTSSTIHIKLGDEWIISNQMDQCPITGSIMKVHWGTPVLIHLHGEGSYTPINDIEEDHCPGCGVEIPESYKMILLLQELDNEV